MTRNQHVVSTTFPEITEARAAQHRQECVVDGEIVAFEGSETRFERLQQRLGQSHPGKDLIAKYPVYYYVFDVLYSGGRDARPLPLGERKEVLRAPGHRRRGLLPRGVPPGLGRADRQARRLAVPGRPDQGLAEVQV